MAERRVAVIGGGIAGLAAAGTLARASKQRQLQVTLLERAAEPGGWIRSGSRHGCVYELGPRTIRSSSPTVSSLLSMVQECGLAEDVLSVSSKHPGARTRYILLNGRPVPMGRALTRSLLWPATPFRRSLIGWALGQLRRPAPKPLTSGEDTSLDEFGRSRLGDDLTDFLLDPMMRGIFAGRLSQLSAACAAPFLLQLEREHNSLLIGLLRGTKQQQKQHELLPSDSAVWSLRLGLGSLPNEYLRHLRSSGVQCRLGVEVESIGRSESPTGCLLRLRDTSASSSEEQHYDHVICCAPSYEAGRLIGGSLGQQLQQQLSFATVAVVSLLFKENVPAAAGLNGFGHLVPSSSCGHYLGVIYDSCVLPQHMAEGFEGSQLTCMLGGAWYNSLAELSEQQLIQLALDGLKEQLGQPLSQPLASNCSVLPRCIPQYPVGHRNQVAAWREAVRSAGWSLSLAGCSYDGVSVPDCANSGISQAHMCLQHLP